MKWKDQAALVFGFFQMVGFNRYDIGKPGRAQIVDFLDVLQRLDKGWAPPPTVKTSRKLGRPSITNTRPRFVSHLEEILPYGRDSRVEAEIEHEYLPFSMAKLTLSSCDQVTADIEGICGIIVETADSQCECWVNMPTFKSNSLLIRFLSRFAAVIKVPSRVTTFVEMALSGSRNGTEHVKPLRNLEGPSFSLIACDIGDTDCAAEFAFNKGSKLKLFRGAPSTVRDVAAAVDSI